MTVRSLSERLDPWARYRGRTTLRITDAAPGQPDVSVTRTEGNGSGDILVWIQEPAYWQVRKDWPHQREADSIPSDDEIGAWLAYLVIDRGGDRGTV